MAMLSSPIKEISYFFIGLNKGVMALTVIMSAFVHIVDSGIHANIE